MITKQEEIAELVNNVIAHWHTAQRFSTDWQPLYGGATLSQDLILGLHSQGVVIKVEGELPEEGVAAETKEFNDGFEKGQSYYKMQIRKAGYVAVEPLKEE